MRQRILIALLLSLVASSRRAVADAGVGVEDSLYANPGLGASTTPVWSPGAPIPAARPWETALRFPGRVASFPLVLVGRVTERSLVYLEQSDARDRVLQLNQRLDQLGIGLLPASLGDHTGLGGEVRWSPPYLQRRVRVDLNGTVNHDNRERVSAALGPVGATYVSEWRPSELYFGPGMAAPAGGSSAYAVRTQTAKLMLSWGWQGYDTTLAHRSDPWIFRDRVHLRGTRHRTWVSAWAGPREAAVSRGREPDMPSFELVHPIEAAGSLDRRIEQLTYGVGVSHDQRTGLPHWAEGWSAALEAERFDRAVRGLSFGGTGDARAFTRFTAHGEAAASFGRDPRTLRLEVTGVDQRLDPGDGVFLISDLQTLGGSAGLAGFEAGRFRDVDLGLAKLSYLFPLVKNLEFDLHGETGAVTPHLSRARWSELRGSFGAALRIRTETAVLAALAVDWSSEHLRFGLTLQGLE